MASCRTPCSCRSVCPLNCVIAICFNALIMFSVHKITYVWAWRVDFKCSTYDPTWIKHVVMILISVWTPTSKGCYTSKVILLILFSLVVMLWLIFVFISSISELTVLHTLQHCGCSFAERELWIFPGVLRVQQSVQSDSPPL